MLPKNIAFVDIETTGTSLLRDRIIEIGVLRVENNKLVDTYKTLVNPETYLPEEISAMTGISGKDLEDAPTFSGIGKNLKKILSDCVFVAHNARFDYGFIKTEFKRDNFSFKAKNLCTVKLSRALFPEHQRHGLDFLIERFGFNIKARHRAFDDAEVLWKFYKLLLKTFPEEKLLEAVDQVMKKPSLPINLSAKTLDDLPESPGVYIFYGQDGMPLYVGKSVNIHDRVLSHFASDHTHAKEMKLSQQVASIETIETAGELGALFKESELIKKLQPLYNHQLRYARKLIVLKQVRGKYSTLKLEEVDLVTKEDLESLLGVFRSKKQATEFLLGLAKEHSLCEKLLGLEKGKGECFAYRLGKCHGACTGLENPVLYNGRFTIAFSKSKLRRWPFDGAVAIEERSLEDDSIEKHIIKDWCYLGTLKNNSEDLNIDTPFDLDTYKILSRHLNSLHKQNINPYNL